MKTCFVDLNTRSIADLCPYMDGFIITRINVPSGYRGKGSGSELLKQICINADQTKTTLYLEILPSGPLNYGDLEAWYKRYGFTGSFIYKRKPRS